MSLAPGTSRRTSTPSDAAAQRAFRYGVCATKYASVSHSRSCAAAAISWASRNRAPELRGAAATQFDAGVAPGIQPARRIAQPPRGCAQAGHEADVSIYGQHLAMVAGEPAERAVESRRIEAADLATRLHDRLEQRSPRARAEPVVDEPNAYARPSPIRKGGHELAPDGIVADDVALEENTPFRGTDGIEPRRKVLGCILQDAHAVSGDQRGPGGARERLICERTERLRLEGPATACLEGEVEMVHRPAKP